MVRLPKINHRHKVCIICEGYEEIAYLQRLITLAVWSDSYDFVLINAKSASNIPARFQDAYQNNRYEIVLIFCDTDKYPYREYALIKKKINQFLNKQKAAENLILFANPCTMQIILLHFGEILLKNQGKKTNSADIERLTGIQNYDAHEDQIRQLCSFIHRRSYTDMRYRVETINRPDTESGSTNFIIYLNRFESDDTKWIEDLRNTFGV